MWTLYIPPILTFNKMVAKKRIVWTSSSWQTNKQTMPRKYLPFFSFYSIISQIKRKRFSYIMSQSKAFPVRRSHLSCPKRKLNFRYEICYKLQNEYCSWKQILTATLSRQCMYFEQSYKFFWCHAIDRSFQYEMRLIQLERISCGCGI